MYSFMSAERLELKQVGRQVWLQVSIGSRFCFRIKHKHNNNSGLMSLKQRVVGGFKPKLAHLFLCSEITLVKLPNCACKVSNSHTLMWELQNSDIMFLSHVLRILYQYACIKPVEQTSASYRPDFFRSGGRLSMRPRRRTPQPVLALSKLSESPGSLG